MRQPLAKLARCAVVLSVLVSSACARQDAPATRPVRREVAVSDLIGHSPSEVAAVLIGKPVRDHGLFVSAVSREGGREVTVLDDGDLMRTGAACESIELDAGAGSDRVPIFRFVARRLVSVDLELIPPTYDAPTPNAPKAKILRSQCVRNPPTTLSDVGMGVAAAPLFVLSVPEAVKRRVQYFKGKAALSELLLGAPVPGGVAGFAGAHRAAVKTVNRADGTVDLQIDMGVRHLAPGDDGPYDLHVIVHDGRITRFAKGDLASGLPCRLDAIWLDCGPPDFWTGM